MSIPFNNLINPISRERFLDEYKGKKHFIIKSKDNIFENHFSWKEFDNYLNQINVGNWDRTPQLQIVLQMVISGVRRSPKRSIVENRY